MKIGILTHPLHSNYGGILQCYALNTYLKKKGHDTVVIQRVPNKQSLIKVFIKKILKKIGVPRFNPAPISDKALNLSSFITSYINFTKPIDSHKEMKRVCDMYGLNAVVVGSDQVWREDFARNYGYNYFLDFVPANVLKLSYAASFGLSEWYYNEKQTRKIKQLISTFHKVSVREFDAKKLCEENLAVSPSVLIDPTLLLSYDDYERISSPRLISNRYIFVYWLGDGEEMLEAIKHFQKQNYYIVIVHLRANDTLPSVEDWLSYIRFSDFVVTDSFHGCVLSLIFQKKIYLYGNASGGNGRLDTLLNILNVDNNGIGDFFMPDYNGLNMTLDNLRTQTHDFFRDAFI